MSEQLSFYDMQDGADTILLTDGETGTFAYRSDFVDPTGASHEQMFKIMGMLGAAMPLDAIKEEDGENVEKWIQVDDRGNPLH